MAGGISVRIVSSQIARVVKDAREASTKAVEAIAVDLRSKAIRRITSEGLVDTGTLRASIAYKVRGRGANAEAFVGSNVHYAIYIHEGTGIFYEGDLPQGAGANPPWVYPDPKTGQMVLTYGNQAYKFLEGPLQANIERYRRVLVNTLRSGMLRWERG